MIAHYQDKQDQIGAKLDRNSKKPKKKIPIEEKNPMDLTLAEQLEMERRRKEEKKKQISRNNSEESKIKYTHKRY